MPSHGGLFDKLQLGPQYTRHSGVGTWTPSLVKAGVFMCGYQRLEVGGGGREGRFQTFLQ